MAVPSDTSHHAQEVIPLFGGALGKHLGSVCRHDSQTLSFEYTFVAKKYLCTYKFCQK